ncbi:MAG: hypothetical protein KME47_21150 [Nodosilinea sp. WJT8-NPBG4]|nr:hypothetical protein [Nodosilinea sp. WJT8-NPBG4]
MRPNLLSYAGGLGLVAGALMWPGVSHAQGFCYLINSEGEVVNLDDMCQENDAPETSPTPEASDASAEPQGTSSSSEVRNTTVISPTGTSPAATSPGGGGASPAGTPGIGEEPGQVDPTTDDVEAAPAGAESPSTQNSETTSDTPDDATERGNRNTELEDRNADPGNRNTESENRLDIPVREIETPEIPEVQTPQRLDSTGDDADTSGDNTDTSEDDTDTSQ